MHSLCLRRSVSSHAFVRYLLHFLWSEYKNRYHFYPLNASNTQPIIFLPFQISCDGFQV
jgi:hypothetical protein